MRVLITGASGFVGSRVTRALLASGHDVLALVVPGDPMIRLRGLTERIGLLHGDLADVASHRPLLESWKPDACIHLAWYVVPGQYLKSPQNIRALTASLGLIDVLSQVGCRQMVAVGTCAEYDTDSGFLREDSPTHPSTLYASTKLALRLVGEQAAAEAGLGFAWARLFYLYGPDEGDKRVVPLLIRALLAGTPFPATKGEQVRDYLHVDDVASALMLLVEQEVSGVFNVSSGIPVTIRQLMEAIGRIVGRTDLIKFGELPYRDWEPMFICGDSRRIRALGWKPIYDLEAGLTQTIDWWRNVRDQVQVSDDGGRSCG